MMSLGALFSMKVRPKPKDSPLTFCVHRQFHNLYFHTDPAVKAHLAKIYADHDLGVADKTIVIID